MHQTPETFSQLAWGKLQLKSETPRRLALGKLRLSLEHRADELWLRHWHAADSGAAPPDEGLWSRWVLPDDNSFVALKPALPDRTLVAAPEFVFSVAPGASARIYLRVPATVVVGSSGESALSFLEAPSTVLSDTWWGSLSEGELCYWLPTSARRVLSSEGFQPDLVICPVLIRNQSKDVLDVDKLAVRARHLSIFAERGRLWSDQTQVIFHGDEEGSEIATTGLRPEEAPGASLVTPPRSPIERGFRARTFARLRSISGLGG